MSAPKHLMRIVLLTFCIVHSLAEDDQKTSRLKLAKVQTEYSWTNWLGHKKLTYDTIKTENLKELFGEWSGSYFARAERYKVEERAILLTVSLNSDGKWQSSFRPEMQNGHWYLYDGMILLYENPITAPEPQLVSALMNMKGQFCFLNADTADGFVALVKKAKALEGESGRNPP